MLAVRQVLVMALLLTLCLLLVHPPTRQATLTTILSHSTSSVGRLLGGVDWSNMSTVDYGDSFPYVSGDSDEQYYDYDASNRSAAELIQEYEQYEGGAASNTTRDATEAKPNTISWEEKMEARFTERLATLRKACQKYDDQISYSVYKTLKSHLFLSKKYNLMVCAVAKAGSSTWKTHLLTIRGVTEVRNVHEVASLHARYQLGLAATRRLMDHNSTTRVMNARQPLDRLVSAYRDKYQDGQPMAAHTPHVRKALKSVGRKVIKDAAVAITFQEFLRHVLTEQRRGWLTNAHWRNYYRTCSPCALHYDYIVKTETYSEDLYYIFKKIGATEVEAGRRLHTTNTTQAVSSHYYEHVEPSLLREIYEVYQVDFEMFGYDIPDFLKDII